MGSRPNTESAPEKADAPFTRRHLFSSSSSSSSHKAAVYALAWSHNGKKLVSASADGMVKVWSVHLPDGSDHERKDKLEHEFTHGSKEFVTCLLFHPKRDDQLLVVGGHVTKVYNLEAKNSVSIVCEADVPNAISASWDSRDRILVARLKNLLTCIDMKRAGDKSKKRHTRELQTRRGGDEITGVTFIDEGSRVLLSTTHGVEVRSWPHFDMLTILDGHAKHGGRDGGVTAMAVTREEPAAAAAVAAAAAAAPGKGGSNQPLRTRLLATGGNDTLVCIWDLQQGVPQTIIYRPDEAVRALSFSADQSLLAYCQGEVPGQTSNAEIMNAKTGQHVVSIPLQRNTEALAFNPRHSKLLAVVDPHPASSYRDPKSKDALPCFVDIVHLK